jgi:hypothetical protein
MASMLEKVECQKTETRQRPSDLDVGHLFWVQQSNRGEATSERVMMASREEERQQLDAFTTTSLRAVLGGG